ncbi:MAG TPA: hypothetical protein VGG06_27690 [Thermoanaerobaculia bacterium]|jgi:hypothetical protein
MDPNRLKEAYQQLESLEDRLAYKIRPRTESMITPTVEHVDAKLRDLAAFTLELKDIVREFMLAFAKAKSGQGG